MAYITWLVLIGLIIWSYNDPKFPTWIPLVAYLLIVVIRAIEKIGNYVDWKKINQRDEKLKLKETAEGFRDRNLTFGGMRKQAEAKVKEDFEYNRKKRKRKFWVELVNTIFLK